MLIPSAEVVLGFLLKKIKLKLNNYKKNFRQPPGAFN